MSSEESASVDRRYVCDSCDDVVRARWFGPGSFAVGCECTTVPIVPQMGQPETPDKWRVERPECCRGVEAKTLETVYGEPGDYRCPDCGAQYQWNGEMCGAPETSDESRDGDRRLVTDGGTDASVVGRPNERIGRGTWLVDRTHYGDCVGVVTEVQQREDEMSARLGIRWRDPNSYENISVRAALRKFRTGRWEVDHAE